MQNEFPLRDMQQYYDKPIFSRKSIRDIIPSLSTPRQEEREYPMRAKYLVEIKAPEDHENQANFRWAPPSKWTNDLEAAKLWVTQYLLEDTGVDRSQAVIYEIEYTDVTNA